MKNMPSAQSVCCKAHLKPVEDLRLCFALESQSQRVSERSKGGKMLMQASNVSLAVPSPPQKEEHNKRTSPTVCHFLFFRRS